MNFFLQGGQDATGCGGYAFGLNATEHAANGLFDDAAVTVWERGSTPEVIWKSKGKHRGMAILSSTYIRTGCNFAVYIIIGGYAYRLCKLPPSGISGVTEKCFQDGHLNFSGPYTWLMVLTNHDEGVTWDIQYKQTALRYSSHSMDLFLESWTILIPFGRFQI